MPLNEGRCLELASALPTSQFIPIPHHDVDCSNKQANFKPPTHRAYTRPFLAQAAPNPPIAKHHVVTVMALFCALAKLTTYSCFSK